jgi:hypothetical protein
MQTLEPTHDLEVVDTPEPSRRGRRWVAFGVAILLIVALTAAIAYAFGSSNSTDKTVVRTVEPPAPKTPAAPAVDDRGFSKLDNGHQAATNVFFAPMDPATRQLLQHQLELAREVAMKYPTVQSAIAAGYTRAGPFSPGLGAHYFDWAQIGHDLMPNGQMTDDAILHPASLIYDGTKPNSRIAGLMYYSASAHIPEGFAGTNDIWHYHTDVCIVYHGSVVDTPFGADTTVSPAMCKAVGGYLDPKTQWMLHAWVVPGYDSPEGIFSHDNEAITCLDGSYDTIQLNHIGNRASVCLDGGE